MQYYIKDKDSEEIVDIMDFLSEEDADKYAEENINVG